MSVLKKACIIDDDRLYVSLMSMIVDKYDLVDELVLFENGDQALKFFELVLKNKIEAPQVVLLDLNMPIMNGWELLDVLEDHTAALQEKGIHLLVVSSSINQNEIAKAKKHALVSDFITKPLSKTHLLEIFNKISS
ncbi:two-component response regulator [Nonlabens tegetincola]|uniref:Two-component response regulator n=1 Tax=Nonlabens tegetincola TaxID=323273 RepID=A0A090Q0G8_9FLAO|nr:response regulator [Nonlabens tegetincola]GAK95682.1 two-component response regulator [Nonlabens tegetincola]